MSSSVLAARSRISAIAQHAPRAAVVDADVHEQLERLREQRASEARAPAERDLREHLELLERRDGEAACTPAITPRVAAAPSSSGSASLALHVVDHQSVGAQPRRVAPAARRAASRARRAQVQRQHVRMLDRQRRRALQGHDPLVVLAQRRERREQAC